MDFWKIDWYGDWGQVTAIKLIGTTNGDSMIIKLRNTLTAILLSAVFLVLAHFAHFELFEFMIDQLQALEQYEVDEFIVPFIVTVIAFLTDVIRKNTVAMVEVEKAKIYKAMVFSVQHIMNNFLNQMQLFKMTADTTPNFDPRVLAMYDGVINDAKAQIAAISAVTDMKAAIILTSVKP